MLCWPQFYTEGGSNTSFFTNYIGRMRTTAQQWFTQSCALWAQIFYQRKIKHIAPRWIIDNSALPFYTDNKGAVSYIALRRGRRGLECHTTLILLEQRVPLPFYALQGVTLPFYTDNNVAVSYVALLHGCRGLQCHRTLMIMEK